MNSSLVAVAPGDEVAAVVLGQVEAADLVVRGDDDAADVRDAVFRQELLIDAVHVGRGGDDGLHVFVEGVAVDIAEIARLTDAQHDGFQNAR